VEACVDDQLALVQERPEALLGDPTFSHLHLQMKAQCVSYAFALHAWLLNI